MKDETTNRNYQEKNMHVSLDGHSNDITYTDVVIIGNGPSGICLSYMLAGNWPYYTGEPHPRDEMLTARLRYCTKSSLNEKINPNEQQNGGGNVCRSITKGRRDTTRGLARIVRNKLECLSTGVEGRGGARSLPLLMDQLQHPCVDVGLDVASLLAWKSAEQRPEHTIIDHIVLGKGEPGGAWQLMDPNVLTISLSRWMSLPELDLRHWEMLVEAEQLHNSMTLGDEHLNVLPQDKKSPNKATSRVSVGTVAAYYKDYVVRQGLEKYFRCGTTVTSVRHVPETINIQDDGGYNWLVEGFDNETGEPFKYRCKKTILATGTTDLSNHLPGERTKYDWVTHNLNDLEMKLDRLANQRRSDNEEQLGDPILIIGSGLSAADAIMAARFRGIPVLHAFRDISNKQKDKMNVNYYDRVRLLPSSIYPEYHKVYEMMADGGSNYTLYKALPDYTLVEIAPNNNDVEKIVTLCDSNGELHRLRVSLVGIFIGFKPDLFYFENNGIGLGRILDEPIDSKTNPIDVDNLTYEVINSPGKGLYALGPLVGDNFVRFILGGAFGIFVDVLSSFTA